MKRLFAIVCVLLLMSGCATNKQGEELTPKSVADMLLMKDYDTLLENSSEEFNQKLPKSALANIFDGFSDKYKIIQTNDLPDVENAKVYEVLVELEDKLLTLKITIKDDKLIDLFYNTSNKPSNNNFKETRVSLGDSNITIKGTILEPEERSYPLVIIVGDSGPLDRNGTIGENTFYLDLAHKLGQNNIGSIRVEKASARGDIDDISDMLNEEYIEAFNYVINMALDNKTYSKVYVLGHGLGGMVAPHIVREKEIDGMMIVNSSLRAFEDIMYDQKMLDLDSTINSLSSEDIQARKTKYEADHQLIKNNPDSNDFAFNTLPISYFKDVNQINTANTINELNMPVLIMHGENNLHYSLEEDYNSYQNSLDSKDTITYATFANLNHLMMKTDGEDINECLKDGEISEDFINKVKEFIMQ